MKIFLIACVDLDKNDGQSTHVTELYRSLRKSCDLRFFVYRSKNPIQDKRVTSISYHQSDNFLLKALSDWIYQLKLFFILAYYVSRDRPDIFYCRHTYQSISPLLISKLARIPLIIEFNGILSDEISNITISRPAEAIARLIERINYRGSGGVVTVDEGIMNELQKYYGPKNITVIPNGTNVDLFRPLDPNESRRLVGLPDGHQYVCFVGNLAVWQGVDHLIDGVSKILEKHPNVRFLIVGGGARKNELQQFTQSLGLSEAVIFTGNIPHEQVPLYIASSDICVAPFLKGRKASPMKIFEYLACGKPVVSSDIPGASRILNASGGGILVAPESSELENAITMLLDDEASRRSMGKAGRAYVEKNCTWDGVAAQVIRFCRSVCEK